MNNNSENTDQYFRDHLGGFEKSPPDASWNMITQRLGKKKKKGMLMLFVRIAAGMALIVSTGLGVYLVSRSQNEIPATAMTSDIAVPNKNKNVDTLPNPSGLAKGIRQSRKIAKYTNPAADQHVEVITVNAGTNEELPVVDQNRGFAVADKDTSLLLSGIKNNNLPAFINNPTDKNLHHRDKPVPNTIAVEPSGNYEYTETANIIVSDKPKKERWSMGSEVAPLYSYRTISSDDLASNQLDNLNASESGIISYAGGINIAYSAGKRLSVQSGVYYSRYGQNKNQITTVSNRFSSMSGSGMNYKSVAITNSTGEISGGLDDLPEAGFIANDFFVHRDLTESYGMVNSNVLDVGVNDVEDAVVRQYFDYFELPVIVKYKFIDRKMDVNISGGLVTNILVGNSVEILGNENTSSNLDFQTTNISQINYVGSVGLGIEYPLDGKIALTLEPRFRYYLNPIDKTSVVVHPFSFGIFGGFNFRF
jgi:hypothetical protein